MDVIYRLNKMTFNPGVDCQIGRGGGVKEFIANKILLGIYLWFFLPPPPDQSGTNREQTERLR